jgi:hypothetical protein
LNLFKVVYNLLRFLGMTSFPELIDETLTGIMQGLPLTSLGKLRHAELEPVETLFELPG